MLNDQSAGTRNFSTGYGYFSLFTCSCLGDLRITIELYIQNLKVSHPLIVRSVQNY